MEGSPGKLSEQYSVGGKGRREREVCCKAGLGWIDVIAEAEGTLVVWTWIALLTSCLGSVFHKASLW